MVVPCIFFSFGVCGGGTFRNKRRTGREGEIRVKEEGQSQAQTRGVALLNLTIYKRLLEDSIYKASFFVAAVTSTQFFFFNFSVLLWYSNIGTRTQSLSKTQSTSHYLKDSRGL